MLEQLVIQNFQAHKSLTLDFDPLVTTIVGSSDVGKSAVVRALYWLVANKPGGDEFIRHGQDSTLVRLDVSRVVIKRRKGKGANSYVLNGKKMVAFGADVPPEVRDALGMSPKINFQRQHDAPFWFSLSAGEVSRELNEIVDLSLIDSTLSYINSKARECQSQMKVSQDRLAEAEIRRSSLSHALEFDTKLQALESQERVIAQKGRDRVKLTKLVTDALRLKEQSKRAARPIREGLRGLETTGNALNLAVKQQVRLKAILLELQYTRSRLAAATGATKEYAKEFEQKMGPVCPLCGKTKK